MDNEYCRVWGDDYRSVYVVGDLHGCYSALQDSLKKADFDEQQDLLISVGDLVDRGSENLECLRLLDKPWFKAVKGNHEEMMCDCLLGEKNEAQWYRNGGNWFWDLPKGDRIEAYELAVDADKLPLVIECIFSGQKVIIAHADYPFAEYKYGKSLQGEDTLWSRQRYMDLRNGLDAGITGADHFYFGHTPDKEVIDVGNIHYIDTGCVFGDKLTIVKIK